MRQAVQDAFVSFTEKFEGKVPWMYLDVKGLVTCAIGNLCDPLNTAIGLPFKRPDDIQANHAEIANEWNFVKSLQSMASWGGMAFGKVTKLRLDDAGIAQVVQGKLLLNESILRTRFPDWDTWPADAQLGVHSMAWAAGAAFQFPKFLAAAQIRDWVTCSAQCHMDDSHNPGLRPRNAANQKLFLNAAEVDSQSLDPEVLLYV